MPTPRKPNAKSKMARRQRGRAFGWLAVMASFFMLVSLVSFVYAARTSAYCEFYPTPSTETVALSEELTTVLESTQDSEKYYYRNLTERARGVYDAVEFGVRCFSPVIYLPQGTTNEELRCAVRFMLADNPDIFWFDGRGTCKRTDPLVSPDPLTLSKDEPDREYTSFSPMYLRSREEATREANEYADLAERFFADDSPYAPARGQAQATEAFKLEMIFRYLADTATYRHFVDEGQSLSSALGDGESVCAGYSKAACFIARTNGIACVYIGGNALNGLGGVSGPHAWMVAVLGGKVAYCDPLWYDNKTEAGGYYSSQWFDCDKQMFERYHSSNYPQLYPENKGEGGASNSQDTEGASSSTIS